MPSYTNTINACRKTGVAKAKRLASEYRNTYPAASANVDCEWRQGRIIDDRGYIDDRPLNGWSRWSHQTPLSGTSI